MSRVVGKVVRRKIPAIGERWNDGYLDVEVRGEIIRVWLRGFLVQWFQFGDLVEIISERIDKEIRGSFELYRLWKDERVKVWPLYSKEYTYPRLDPITGEPLYTYKLLVREASELEDYISIIELEQYHYASRKELVALWRCPDGRLIEANVPPCEGAIPVAIKGSLPASRFLILELLERQPFEPKIVGYVRVDPPIPAMHRRIIENGKVLIERNIRLKVFPREWIYPTFWPEALLSKLRTELKELRRKYGRAKALHILGEKVKEEALKRCNTAAARIARVVIHPDYRGDGLGMFAVRAVIAWVTERRIPEMKKRKHLIEVIAQMARYHPFFERVGFRYLWDTASGRPVLYYPLTKEAKELIEHFLKTDKYASQHKGVLYRPSYNIDEPLSGPIELKGVTKSYESVLDISILRSELVDVLKAFGVTRRIVQKYVLRNVNITIKPKEIVAVLGLSGAGKTTLLRLIYGAAIRAGDQRYNPDEGRVVVPHNTRVAALFPGEVEPTFGDEPLLQHMYNKLGDVVAAIEVLNMSGLSDAVFYRAKFSELSTGQKERAKIASLLAEKPNLIIIDEFTAHLDVLTAQRVARKISKIAREQGITLIVATNRPEVLKALSPTKILYVGYGNVMIKTAS